MPAPVAGIHAAHLCQIADGCNGVIAGAAPVRPCPGGVSALTPDAGKNWRWQELVLARTGAGKTDTSRTRAGKTAAVSGFEPRFAGMVRERY